MSTTTSHRLSRDDRGGSQFITYLILVAGIALVALAGVRAYERSVRTSFERSSQRFDAPGTYVGGSIYTTRASIPPRSSTLPPAPGTIPGGDSTIPPGGTVPGGDSTIPPGGTAPGGDSTIPPGGTAPGGDSTIPPGGTAPGGGAVASAPEPESRSWWSYLPEVGLTLSSPVASVGLSHDLGKGETELSVKTPTVTVEAGRNHETGDTTIHVAAGPGVQKFGEVEIGPDLSINAVRGGVRAETPPITSGRWPVSVGAAGRAYLDWDLRTGAVTANVSVEGSLGVNLGEWTELEVKGGTTQSVTIIEPGSIAWAILNAPMLVREAWLGRDRADPEPESEPGEQRQEYTWNDSTRDLEERYRTWRAEHGSADPMSDWYYYWCGDAAECTIDEANRRYDEERAKLLRQGGAS